MVTVILPVHNGANYLASAIASVLAQDCEFTLHVLDDGSTDASAEIAQATGDARVHYSRNPAKFGLFKTLNRGFNEARTPLVRIWAHDDLMLPGSLGRFVDFAENNPSAGMIYCDFLAIDSVGKRTGDETKFHGQRVRTPNLATPDVSALLFFCFGCLPGNISTVMLRRQAWLDTGGFLEGIQQAPDYDMWVRIGTLSDVGFLREKLIELRDHPLQLAKVGQKQMTTISEEFAVCQELRRQLLPLITERELVKFWKQNRGRQHAHWIVKALLSREWDAARRGWSSLTEYNQAWSQLAFWLVSGNGRLFTTRGESFFDRYQMPSLQKLSSS